MGGGWRCTWSTHGIHSDPRNTQRSTPTQLSTDTNQHACTFWGFYSSIDAPKRAATMIAHGQMPLIFDLDETLLVAFSFRSLDKKVRALKEEL